VLPGPVPGEVTTTEVSRLESPEVSALLPSFVGVGGVVGIAVTVNAADVVEASAIVVPFSHAMR
jgi:hypothetical protein